MGLLKSNGIKERVAAVHEILAKSNFDNDSKFLTPTFLASRNWILHTCEFSIIDVTFKGNRPLRVRLSCDDWDEQAPSADLLDIDGLKPAQGLPGGIFHSDQHPNTHRPFICMRGFREYHTHPSHLGDYWATYRGQDGMNLSGLLDQLSRAWRKAVGT
jgi:hypothetical protein